MQRRIVLLSFLCLFLAAPAGLQAEETPEPSRQARPGSATHLLSLALLVASNDYGPGEGDPLPAPVAKAVADIKDFLPFRQYRMHDAAVVRTANLEPARVQLQGPGSTYTGLLRYQLEPGGTRLNFSEFVLIQAQEVPRPPRAGPRNGTPAPPAPSREVISTGFSIDVGETIVVGTSRLGGSGSALVLVLTALPARQAEPRSTR
jgi:hypothetical protein